MNSSAMLLMVAFLLSNFCQIVPQHSQGAAATREKVVTVISSHTDQGALADAEVKFQLPLSAQNLSPSELYDRGEALLLQSNPSDALPYLAVAAELLPQDAFAQGNFAIALHQACRLHLDSAGPHSLRLPCRQAAPSWPSSISKGRLRRHPSRSTSPTSPRHSGASAR